MVMSNHSKNHPRPEVHGLVLDFRNLTMENQKLVMDDILNQLSSAEKANIFILHSEEQN
jgi:hypothetical protein